MRPYQMFRCSGLFGCVADLSGLVVWRYRSDALRGEVSNWADRDESTEQRRANLHDLFQRSEGSFDNLDSVVSPLCTSQSSLSGP